MSLAHRELAKALETQRQLEELHRQAERFKSLSQVNVSAIQARGMALSGLQARSLALSSLQARSLALSSLQARSMASALSGIHARGIFTSRISPHMIPSIPYIDINFTEITNNLVNNFQNFSNNWVIYKPINILESTVDIGNNEVEENLADNIDQEFTVDEKSPLDQANLYLEIDRLCSELYQDRRIILNVILPTLRSYSILLGILEGSDNALLSVLIILGNFLLYRWNKKPPTKE